ncbi:hypothetical protein C8R45DRAFT_840395 [Mycena sanguinolenta]|nr:hypothetical protein C8R45DRAFT_840395 [Mycena sanguinolenta]
MEDFHFKLPDDVPFYENQLDYVRVKEALLDHHIAARDMRSSIIQYSKYLTDNPGASLVDGAANGDGEKRLEIAVSGCGFLKKIELALSVLGTILDPDNEDPTDDVSNELLARALSCAAYAHIELYEKARGERKIKLANDHLYTATICADAAVSRGLTSSIALQIAALLRRSGTQFNLDVRNSPRYRVFRHLWRAMDSRDEEMAAEERKRNAKVAKAPNAYKCAAKGCGVERTSKTALQRCGGKCPPEIKPSYCSKECQKKDWPTHKKVCKQGSARTAGSPSDDSVMEVNIDDDSAVLDDEISEGGVERIIEFPHPTIPGEKLRIVSKHLSPVFLRHLRGLMGTAGATGTE